MIEIDNFEHFSFDLWMTVIKSNPNFKPQRTELLKEHFSLNKTTYEIDSVIRYYDNLFNIISEKTGNHIEREEVFMLILDKLGKDIQNISIDDLKLFFEKSDELFVENVPFIIWEDIHDFLSEIKAKGKTASILSNTAFIHGDSIRKVLKKLDLDAYFSFMIFSDEVGISKPNLEIFEYLYKNTQEIKIITKSQIIHIGDNPIADYQGAKTYGFAADLVKFN
ncbi:HAD family hydrolase [Empedobacter falsenii]|uniref:DUMP phosphatase n=1 Tax=Empedobacter falsenii TaxID=343874 RepID=A0A376GGC0_9FLAO|nr:MULTISPECIES: HAD family hydrolase [Empedobacter]MDH0674246.1 HAD family hydrolase [Empedobacter sp. GD03861]MDH2208050.1 HAD family hydrolase [Empedobacter sp. GD03644]STD58818.1 dUMP phosphatase [Empedobacter falsenii]